MHPSLPVTLRPAYADDAESLQRLATLDSAEGAPPGPLLLAEVEGELYAALSLRTGAVIADPFQPTAALVALLRAHASRVRTVDRRRRRLRLPFALRPARPAA